MNTIVLSLASFLLTTTPQVEIAAGAMVTHVDTMSHISGGRCTLVLALTLTFGLAAFAHPQDPVEVPFEYSRAFGLMLIKVEVNGKPAVMVLDTGSNETIVSPRLVVVKQLSSKEAVAMAKGSGYSGNGVITRSFEGRTVEFEKLSNLGDGFE
jgi:hypothetical protein